jgi:hypothetical protein
VEQLRDGGPIVRVLGALHVTMPELFRSFAWIARTLLTNSEERAVERLYASLEEADSSGNVLARHPPNLTVLPVRGVEWSDLGEPRRVLDVLSRQRIQPRWKVA